MLTLLACTTSLCYHDQHKPGMCFVCIQATYEDSCISGFQGTVLKMVFRELWEKTPNPEDILLLLVTGGEKPRSSFVYLVNEYHGCIDFSCISVHLGKTMRKS